MKTTKFLQTLSFLLILIIAISCRSSRYSTGTQYPVNSLPPTQTSTNTYPVQTNGGNLPPGQAKKIYGGQSAKAYAPGQRKKYPLVIVYTTNIVINRYSDGRYYYRNTAGYTYWKGDDGRYYIDEKHLKDVEYEEGDYDDWKFKGQKNNNAHGPKGKDPEEIVKGKGQFNQKEKDNDQNGIDQFNQKEKGNDQNGKGQFSQKDKGNDQNGKGQFNQKEKDNDQNGKDRFNQKVKGSDQNGKDQADPKAKDENPKEKDQADQKVKDNGQKEKDQSGPKAKDENPKEKDQADQKVKDNGQKEKDQSGPKAKDENPKEKDQADQKVKDNDQKGKDQIDQKAKDDNPLKGKAKSKDKA